jgi:aminoglycoside phosphotransferase
MLEDPGLPASEHDWLRHIPTELQEMLGDAAWEADEWGMSGTHVYRVGQRYLKILPYRRGFDQEQSVLAAEAARLHWLAERLSAPEVHFYGQESTTATPEACVSKVPT